MTYEEGWEELALFSLGAMEGTERTRGFENKRCVLERFAVGEARWQAVKGGSPWSCSHQDGVTAPLVSGELRTH